MKFIKNRVFYIVSTFFACTAMFTMSAQQQSHVKLFPLNEITLLDSPFKKACDLNIKVLLSYDIDRLLAPYLKEAGLQPKGESYPNWDGLDGHVGGHYLSALAITYASTGNDSCKARLDYMISELKRCQDANGNGYVGGVPNGMEMWEKVKNGNPGAVAERWVPWYNVHKTYAGLRDAWTYAGNATAKQMFLDFCDWGLTIISPLDSTQMEQMLDIEFGGMNEIYADAYMLTGDTKYLDAAKRFSHRVIFDNMAAHIDNLDNKHANTQVPKALGYQRVAELTGDEQYATAAEFFWDTVVHDRSLSFGGNSRREHFPSKDACKEYVEEREGPESCNTYNMLKLSEGLFRMEPKAEYADYYERAMFNHILSTQHPIHGGYVYFTPARPRHYRVYSAPNEAMWCCVGTGMENHGKYGEFIYSHENDSLFVNLFVASELDWKENGIRLRQETSFPCEEQSRLILSMDKPSAFTLKVRHPSWVAADEFSISVNGEKIQSNSSPSSYVSINRQWKNNDIVEITLPMHASVEEMPNVPNYISILYGPIVLATRMGTDDMKGLVADNSRWGHIASGTLLPLTDAPVLIGQRDEILAKINNMQPVEGKPLHFTCPGLFSPADKYDSLVLEPFAQVHDCRYSIYWCTMSQAEYDAEKERLAKIEQEKLELDRRTVDMVKPGEQQPEVDHMMQESGSNKGYFNQQSWRDAESGGYFSYNLLTNGEESLSLMVKYWGAESGSRNFDILIDDNLLASENISGKWNKDEFVDVTYEIPSEFLKGKKSVRVCFRPHEGNRAGGVFMVRLLKNK